ncbi:hypothetical protein [Desulfofustis glycolicus]|uniref:hypothetical protein n=1 Tax=Desulfofustis glycolicus TaxID=51195 RepID=UPI0012948667|nr:hypothetical protein [Desulfofustis glycolicus]
MSKEKKHEKDRNSESTIVRDGCFKKSGNFNESVKDTSVVNTAPPPPPRKPSDTQKHDE